MSETPANCGQPTAEQIDTLAHRKAASCLHVDAAGSERQCCYCGEQLFFNQIVLHIARAHRGELIAALQRGADAK